MSSVDVSRYRVKAGSFSLSAIDSSDVQDWDKSKAKDRFKDNKKAIIKLQERLYAVLPYLPVLLHLMGYI